MKRRPEVAMIRRPDRLDRRAEIRYIRKGDKR
jgi:hypothetical protein